MGNRVDSRRKGSKPRPPSKGPQRRRGGNHGNGRHFKPGQNSHTGVVFRRGPDRIPRGTITSLYRAIWDDDGDLAAELFAPRLKGKLLPMRHALARSLILGANDPKQAPHVGETIADRLEGRPVQKVEQRGNHINDLLPRRRPAAAVAPDRPSDFGLDVGRPTSHARRERSA